VLAPVLARLGNPLSWSVADRCLLVAVAVLPFAAWHTAILYHGLAHPETAPYLDHAFIARIAPFVAFAWLGGWIALVLVALLVRRRFPDLLLLETATIQLYCVGGALLTYTAGAYTTNYMGAVGLAGFVVGLILFERRRVIRGAAVFVGITYLSVVAEQFRLIPYAPMMRESPAADGHLNASWLMGFGHLTGLTELFGLVLIYLIVTKWREREEKLAVTSEQLSRANELISRFVAVQVADQIRAGNYDAVDRTDRRRLTIFFSDIKDFSAIADRIEPEELSEILNEYFDEMVNIAERYGATVDKFMGDAIMIFFGAPVGPHEPDHALRAVRMGMEMQHRMRQLHERWRSRGVDQQPFVIRIGINTGIANVGAFGARGRMDYTAIGRQVNLAARLQVNCEPGGILLSHSTWTLVKDHIACVAKGEVQVKGFHHPIQVYQVDAVFVPEAAPPLPARESA
jgi:class 3 adenylate cyclase